MRVSLEWLGEFVPLPDPGELTDRLELGGFEDVVIEETGPDLSAFRVGCVRERAPHPNADRLSVCKVDLGGEDPVEVVCGAPNVAAGQKVAFAQTGTRLPDGMKLKRSKIRGVVSNGMICSSRELGLGADHEGILVLDPDAPVGAPLAEVLGAGPRILEVGITPNRGDTASVVGLAREVRALFGGALTPPQTAPPESGDPAESSVSVRIDAPDACHRYAARVVRGVRPGPSPDWVVRKLEASGIRAINCVVDVTNLVLLEFGQPLHAFDLARVAGGAVRVRQARAGETLRTLDGQERKLDPRDLVIADPDGAIALAGVMGGADTEVGDETRDVLIESAHFDPTSVRLTARRHGLHSEASYRFERGVDRAGVERAADRAARLLAEIAGGAVAPGCVVATGSLPEVTEEIALEVARANRLLGTSLGAEEAAELLARVGVECRIEPGGVVRGRIPSHRNDLHLPEDLTEEVARIHGYDRIPTTVPTGPLAEVHRPPGWRLADSARDALCATGVTETVSLPFVGEADLERLRLAPDDSRRIALRVANPLHEEEALLRTTLLPTLLRVVRQNRSRQVDAVRVFEVSRVFHPRGEGERPQEPLQLGVALTEVADPPLWERPAPLFFQAKGIAERLLNQLGYVASFRSEGLSPYHHPGAATSIEVAGRRVGGVGELHPEVATGFEIDVACAVLELDLSLLQQLPPRDVRVREVSRQPQVRRDLAVLLDRDRRVGDVLEAIEEVAGTDLVSAALFDRYEGRGVPEGRVSLGFRLVFQRPDRTLKDAEVARATDRVVRMLAARFGGELR